ncbi:uncharacterized protein CTRU02_214766 [Colletotrichum truncatum]|uniref:Uncharacterized protein n=1 Tax=Colletotrichum truncatum TaxID=5467 RepID=A0ACC3YFR8_COLTU|nr:uncharacterized protein CTRU02_09715 [Colletotrichum truncatum]KAF6788397.1 hypothetical protein CTRU02_09715 [Colletotrichum truncatum]
MPEMDFHSRKGSTNQLVEDLQNPMGDADYSSSTMCETPPSNLFGNNDQMAPLIGVIGTISRQLSELKSQSWDPSFMRTSLFDNNEQDFGGAVRLNPLDNVMHISMKFVLVLQTMVPAECSKISPLCSPPTLSLLLMLISTHLQLGQLFDAILTRVNICLQDEGLSAHSRRLQITMMILFIEHHLSSVERLMGFPADFRLWSRKSECTGILDPESNPLVEAVMGQAQEIFLSLKQTMESIQMSLRT